MEAGAATLGDAVAEASRRFAAVGLPTARLDARLIVGHAIDMPAGALLGRDEQPLSDSERERIESLVERRVGHEPIAHILGEREFWSLPFRVGPDVLIPRPDSETLVEAALAFCTRRRRPLRVLDLGTGSGCLLLAVLNDLSGSDGIGVDISRAALAVARDNAAALGLARRAHFIESDWGDGIGMRFDLILCNPPYIAEGDLGGLDPEVVDFEPRLALAGGDDGLAAYRRIAVGLETLLAEKGAAFVEVGMGMAKDVVAVFDEAGLRVVDIKADLAGIPRCLQVACGSVSED